ncbi:hypothetical protein [Xanthomonas citri]
MMGSCIVISQAQLSLLIEAIGWMFVAAVLTGWFAAFDLAMWEWRVRRYLRRRRLARIRLARVVA